MFDSDNTINKFSDFTDNEIGDLIRKFRQVVNLFGMNMKIRMWSGADNSYCDFNSYSIFMSFDNTCELRHENGDITFIGATTLMMDLIDEHQPVERIPHMLMALLHESAHFMTMGGGDHISYQKEFNETENKNNGNIPPEAYRQMTYERLADNLAYELFLENKDDIIKIFNDEQVIEDKEKIKQNWELARQFREKYLNLN